MACAERSDCLEWRVSSFLKLMALTLVTICLAACDSGTPYQWSLPPGFPPPVVPKDNPLTVEKVELGRHLFYDTRLSANNTQSCGSCHQQAFAFSEPRQTSLGSTGKVH